MGSIISETASRLDPPTKRLIELQGDIAVHLARVLALSGMTQKQLAAATGMKESRISKILSGDENLTLRTIARLELAVGACLIESPAFRSGSFVILPRAARREVARDAATTAFPKPPAFVAVGASVILATLMTSRSNATRTHPTSRV